MFVTINHFADKTGKKSTAMIKSDDNSAGMSAIKQQMLSVHIAEYEAMRAELLQAQGALGQLLLYSLISLGAAIPIVGTLVQNKIWPSLLIIPIVFSSIAWIYSGYLGISYRISIYIKNVLRPAMIALLESESSGVSIDVLSWEVFAHERGADILTLRKGLEAMFFMLPSAGSIGLYLVLQNSVGFTITYAQWGLLLFDIILSVGALVTNYAVTATGSRRLKEGSRV